MKNVLIFLNDVHGFPKFIWGGGILQITSQKSLNEYMGHNKGYKGLDSSMKKFMYFYKECTFF